MVPYTISNGFFFTPCCLLLSHLFLFDFPLSWVRVKSISIVVPCVRRMQVLTFKRKEGSKSKGKTARIMAGSTGSLCWASEFQSQSWAVIIIMRNLGFSPAGRRKRSNIMVLNVLHRWCAVSKAAKQWRNSGGGGSTTSSLKLLAAAKPT